MASPKVGEATRASIMSLVRECLISKGYDVLQVASGSVGVPSVEGEDETAVRIRVTHVVLLDFLKIFAGHKCTLRGNGIICPAAPSIPYFA